jgi:hypothetical protein
MPRPRKNDPTHMIMPLIEQFARTIGSRVERLTTKRIQTEIARALGRKRGVLRTRRSRPAKTCYYPGCKNTAAPRFGMFCAAEHKDLPAAKKKEIRAKREKQAAP